MTINLQSLPLSNSSKTRLRDEKSDDEATRNGWSPAGDAVELFNVEPDEAFLEAGQRVHTESVEDPGRAHPFGNIRPARDETS